MDKQKKWVDFVARYHGDKDFARQVDGDTTKTLREAGFTVPDGVEVKVVKNEAKKWHLIIPSTTDEVSTEELQNLVGGSGTCSTGGCIG